jgi:cobalamin biosynthesis protein CobT
VLTRREGGNPEWADYARSIGTGAQGVLMGAKVIGQSVLFPVGDGQTAEKESDTHREESDEQAREEEAEEAAAPEQAREEKAGEAAAPEQAREEEAEEAEEAAPVLHQQQKERELQKKTCEYDSKVMTNKFCCDAAQKGVTWNQKKNLWKVMYKPYSKAAKLIDHYHDLSAAVRAYHVAARASIAAGTSKENPNGCEGGWLPVPSAPVAKTLGGDI